jgi:hypothetical protein
VTHEVRAVRRRQGDGSHQDLAPSLRPTDGPVAISGRPASLGLPARVVRGTAVQFQKLGFGERPAADLGTTLTPVGGGKHVTPEDHPEVAAAIDELLPTGHPLSTEEHP